MSALRLDTKCVRVTRRDLAGIQARRKLLRQSLQVTIRDHEHQLTTLVRSFDQPELRRDDCLDLLKEIDDEIGRQMAIVEGVKRQIEAMEIGA